ncbi:MAG: M28 family peptidase, partial [Clostridia bacterium]|nr:M28 family peptidase [Clostridia bacterium]
MTELSKKILENYQVRKTKAQKLEFEQLLKDNGVDFFVVEGGFLKSRNLVVGNPKTAKVLLTAHYDTCARLPVPNLIFPNNLILTFLYGLVFGIPVFIGMFLTDRLIIHLFKIGVMSAFISDILLMTTPLLWLFLLFFMLMGPIQNKHTANDNTSGVITLLEIMNKMDEATREKTAFVFFDNEENGLLGSGYYRKVYNRETANQLVINFDCVSDG